MMPSRPGLCAVILLAALASCNRQQPGQTETASPPLAEAPPATPQPSPPLPIPPATELPLQSVESVMLSRPADALDALIIRVSGTAVSRGWTGARLAEQPEADGESAIRTYRLLATSPEMPGLDRTPERLETELRVDMVPAGVTAVRIVAAGNALTVPIAQ